MKLIDHLHPIEAAVVDARNELFTLSCMASGLTGIAQTILNHESPITEYENSMKKNVKFFGFGSPWLRPEDEELMPCLFHWFGITLCNYARLVGFFSGISEGLYTRSATEDQTKYRLIKTHCDAYCSSIRELEPVYAWRNKVFAHFAITDPRPSDNAALLDASVMSPIHFFNHRFRVGGTVMQMRGAEVELPPWSVTETFERLASRYWPHAIGPNATLNPQ